MENGRDLGRVSEEPGAARKSDRSYEQFLALVDELAGILGINPNGFTLRQLIRMAEAKGRDAWNHTAALLATMININRPKGKTPIKADSLNPYARQNHINAMVINREEAVEVFKKIAGKKNNTDQ